MATNEDKHFVIHSKIWIEDSEENVVFGEGRARILEIIDESNSMQAAAGELKMSYRAVWGRIKASEERLGRPLVTREGRGSRLTAFGRTLLERYRQLQDRIHEESDKAFEGLLAEHLDK